MNITNAQFTATGSITALVDGVQMSIPADAGNRHYAAMLEQGITPAAYQVPTAAETLAAERAGMVCSRLQGRLVLGEETCDRLDAIASDPDTPWAMRQTIANAIEWRRTSQSMTELGYVLGYSDNQMDDLFRAAMGVDI